MFMWYKITFLLSCYFFYCDRIEKQIVFIFILGTSRQWQLEKAAYVWSYGILPIGLKKYLFFFKGITGNQFQKTHSNKHSSWNAALTTV